MKCFFLMVLLWFSSQAQAFDLNKASAFELESIAGIGQKMAQKIVLERTSHGFFKSWQDFKERVRGVGDGNLKKMQANGLTLVILGAEKQQGQQ